MESLGSNMIIHMHSEFGDFCARGSLAVNYLEEYVIPNLDANEPLVIDLEGVRNMNSSFCNAFFTNLFVKYGEGMKNRITIINAHDKLKKPIQTSVAKGISKHRELYKTI
ncbi:STAS-like domain-containing protein [Halomonas sp. WWR20]